jgi:hypothetical protein
MCQVAERAAAALAAAAENAAQHRSDETLDIQ